MMADMSMTHFWRGLWLYIGGESQFITLYMQGKDRLSDAESLHKTKSYSIRLYICVASSAECSRAGSLIVEFLESCNLSRVSYHVSKFFVPNLHIIYFVEALIYNVRTTYNFFGGAVY
ncbi:hypothetical protein PIB30_066127 [Stylosanthes scabra]|uniref:Uncharacterized protein n=1 Tax=Stylosanthes scabra TaxID=79078 RepID=A0ABU6XMI8_9FABA|nr:hypothetical protein [Stylosanthes scabra]